MPKKRQHGTGALYEIKSRKLWRAVIDLGFGPDGKRRQISVTSRTQRGARDKLDAIKKEIEENGAPLDKTTTVAQWADVWLRTVCRPRLKPKPLAADESVVRTWIIPSLGSKKVSSVKPSDVRTVYAAISAAGRSSSTALKAHNIMSAMFESARKDKLVAVNVMTDVDAPRAAVSERGALSTETALRVLSAAADLQDGTRWWVALLAGMRQGERLGAVIEGLDFDRYVFTVSWSLTEARFEHGCAEEPCGKNRGGSCPDRRLIVADGLEYRQLDGRLCLVPPKSGKSRSYPMIPPLAEALKRYLEATKQIPNPHGLIWRNADGSPLTAKQDNEAWRQLLLSAHAITEEQAKPVKDRAPGTPDIPTTHWARHTTVTVLTELGVDAKIIGEIVGHGSEAITRHYQHVSSEAARDALQKIGTHFSLALEPPKD